MKTSVIIPTLNEERLLEGMLAQFTPEVTRAHALEVIVSDGGSTDETLAIARRHAATVVENSGGIKQTISLGRNLGAACATGDILVFLNADTRIHDISRFFSRVIDEAMKPGTAAVTCGVEVYPEEKTVADRLYHGFYNWLFRMMNVVGMGMGRGECHVLPRGVFERAGGYAPHIAAGEDYELFRRIKKLGAIRFLDDILVYESPRRYRRYGYLTVSASWFLNFLSVFFLRRSVIREWRPVR